jgi:hypothetical protein
MLYWNEGDRVKLPLGIKKYAGRYADVTRIVMNRGEILGYECRVPVKRKRWTAHYKLIVNAKADEDTTIS